MYPFLNTVSEYELHHVAELLLRSATLPESLSRDEVYSVIFARFGFGLLAEKAVRRVLLRTLDGETLERVAAAVGIVADADRCTLVLSLVALPWRQGGVIVEHFERLFEVPAEFLPAAQGRPPAVERLEPVAPLPHLFDYQEELASGMVDALSAGSPALMMQLPTGAGKTRTTLEAIRRFWVEQDSEGMSVVWMAHTEELCDQALESFQRLWRTAGHRPLCAVRQWGAFRPHAQDVVGAFVVAGYSKLFAARASEPELFDRLLSSTRLLVVDEAHRALAPTTRRLVDEFRARGAQVIGLSATPGRGSDAPRANAELAKLFGGKLLRSSCLGERPIAVLQKRGILSRVRRETIETGVAADDASASMADWFSEDVPAAVLRLLAQNERRNRLILDAIERLARVGAAVLVFACTVEHSRQLAVESACRGVRSACIDGEMRGSERQRIIEAFRRGSLSALFNFGVLSTGFDVPRLEAVVIARPTQSVVLYGQMVGRGLRGSAVGGSDEFVLIDVRDNFRQFGEVDAVYGYFSEYWR